MRHTNSSTNGGHISMTFFTGMALGVALGMLFAPSEGSQLRSRLRDDAERWGRRTADTYNDAAKMMGDWVERGRSATEAGRDAFRRTREQAHGRMEADV